MWMAYVTEVNITDLKSGVQYLSQKFSNLQFDAEHEAVYGMGQFYTEEQCYELATKYQRACDVCEKFLMKFICEECLVQGLIQLELGGFLYPLKDYLRPDLVSRLNFDEDDED